MQYDTGAEVCLITTEMVARLGLSQHGEPCWMELTSTLGGPPVISSRRHRMHFKTVPFSVATVIVYKVDNIGWLLTTYDVCAAEQLFPQTGRADLHANWGITSGAVECYSGSTRSIFTRGRRSCATESSCCTAACQEITC